MELEIRPEPTEAERMAIEAALHVPDRPHAAPWWQDGLRENLELEPAEPL